MTNTHFLVHTRTAECIMTCRNSDKVVGAALFVGLGLGFWQQASGSEAAVYYSPHVLEVRGRRIVRSAAVKCTALDPSYDKR